MELDMAKYQLKIKIMEQFDMFEKNAFNYGESVLELKIIHLNNIITKEKLNA